MPRKLSAELQRLVDRQAILDCIYRYSRGLDRHDSELLASAFWEDAVDNHGDFVGYIPEFVEWGNAGHEAKFAAHTHHITCHAAEIAGDEAHCESYVIFVLRQKDGKTVNVGGGRYVDRLEKRRGEWRILLRRLIMDWRFTADGSVWGSNVFNYEHGRWDRQDASYDRPLKLRPKDQAKLDAKGPPPARKPA